MDLSEFDARVPEPRGLDGILLKLDDMKRAQLLAALGDPRYSARVISSVVNDWGHPLGRSAVDEWRKKHG